MNFADQFLQSYGGAKKADPNTPQNITATYLLYNGDVELLYDNDAHAYFVRRPRSAEPLKVKRVNGTTTITGTLDKPALVPWAVKVAMEDLIAKMEVKTLISNVDNVRYLREGITWELFLSLVKDAKGESKRQSQEALDIGHIAHEWLEKLQIEALRRKQSIRQMWNPELFALPVVKPVHTYDFQLLAMRQEVAEYNTKAAQNCCGAGVSWMLKHNFRPVKVENKVYSIRLNTAGTFDSIAIIDSCGDPDCCGVTRNGMRIALDFTDLEVLTDWKSSKGMYNEYRFQTAFYFEGVREESGKTLGGRVVLKLGKDDGEFKAYFLPNEDQAADLRAFEALIPAFDRIAELEDETDAEKKRRSEMKKNESAAAKQEEEDKKKAQRALRDRERADAKAAKAAEEEKEKAEKALVKEAKARERADKAAEKLLDKERRTAERAAKKAQKGAPNGGQIAGGAAEGSPEAIA